MRNQRDREEPQLDSRALKTPQCIIEIFQQLPTPRFFDPGSELDLCPSSTRHFLSDRSAFFGAQLATSRLSPLAGPWRQDARDGNSVRKP
jgi:hypothetical protein